MEGSLKRSIFVLLMILSIVAPSCKNSCSGENSQLFATKNCSDHDLVLTCDCGILGLNPGSMAQCHCINVNVSCQQHGNSISVDRRTFNEVLCTGVPNGLYAE